MSMNPFESYVTTDQDLKGGRSAPPSKATNLKSKRKPPERYMVEGITDEQYNSLISITGHDSPFAWLMFDDSIEEHKKAYNGDGIMLRENLISLKVQNEKGKYPQVDLELLMPTLLNQGTKDDRLDRLKLGKDIYIYFGYTKAHTKKGPYTIKSRQVDYADGTVRVTISASMGVKLNTTTTSNVITKVSNNNIIDILASVGGMTVDYKDLLEDEFKAATDAFRDVGSDRTIGQRMWHHSTKLDVDLYFDDNANQVKLQTPYVYDLIPKGKKPLRMTYGFPNSNIKSIKTSEKLPSRKSTGGGTKSGLGVTNFLGGTGGFVDEKNHTVQYLVHGMLRVADPNNPNTFVGVSPQSITAARAPVGKEAETVKGWEDQGYTVKKDDDFINVQSDSFTYYHLYRTIKSPNLKQVDEYTNKKITRKEFNDLVARGFYVVIGRGRDDKGEVEGVTGTATAPLFNVNVYTTSIEKAKKLIKGSKSKGSPSSSTSELKVSGDEIYEEKQIDKVRIPIDTLNNELVQERKKNLQKLADYRKQKNVIVEMKGKNSSFEYWVVKKIIGEGKLRSNPGKVETKQEDKEQAPSETTTNSSDGKMRAKDAPSSKTNTGSGNKKAVSRKREREFNIELATGDWTLPVGTLIEIVDLHSSTNGLYVIESESHDISKSGFQTSLKCVKAVSKKKGKKGKASKEGTRKDAQDSKQNVTKGGNASKVSKIGKIKSKPTKPKVSTRTSATRAYDTAIVFR